MESILPGLGYSPTLHPMFVHFPIVLWLTALVFGFWGLTWGREEQWQTGTRLFHLGTLSALVTVAFGYLAANQLGHDSPGHEHVHMHRDFMLVTTAAAVFTSGVALWVRRNATTRLQWTVVGLMLVVSVLMTLGADRGALLVYGHGMGVRAEGFEASPPAEDHSHGHGGHAH